MKLSSEKSRALSRLVWRDRIRQALPLLAFAVLAFAGLTFYFNWQKSHADPTLSFTPHTATVLEVRRQSVRNAAIVHVKLDDGREVDAFSGLTTLLPPGAEVEIAEARHASGKSTYDVMKATHP